MANLRLFSILFLVLALSVTLSSATWKSKSAAASPSKSAAASVSKSAAASPSPSASASVQPTPSVAQNNDFNCPFPDRYYTKAAITRLLYPESISLSTREATLLVYVNIDSNPGAPNFFLVANISGLNILKYNSSLGTLQGFFYVKFGSTYDLNAVYTYNIRGDDDPLVGYNTFCLHFPEDSNVPQYYRGDITADNVATGTYIETKATNSKNPSGLPPGFASRFEYFWDVNDQVINCLTDFDTTGVARVSIMNCIYYKPSNIDPNAAAAAAATAEASDAQRRRRDTGERYLQVGPLSRVNEQLIDPEYRHYFPVSVSE